MVDIHRAETEDEDRDDPDDRRAQRLVDKKIACDEELSESEDEDGRRDHQSFKGKKYRKNGKEGAAAAASTATAAKGDAAAAKPAD